MKKILLATTLLLATSAANAGTVSAAGGVSWEALPTAPNFEASVEYTQWWTTGNTTTRTDYGSSVDTTAMSPTIASFTAALANGDSPELVGVGQFNQGFGLGEPHCASCEITFSFGGFVLNGFTQVGTGTYVPDGQGGFVEVFVTVPDIDASNAWLNAYLDTTNAGEFDEAAISDGATAATETAQAVNGDLWLSFSLANFIYTPDATAGAEPLSIGSSSFFGNVLDGIAQSNFESNFFGGLFDASAFGLTSSFVDAGGSIVNYSVRGTGNVQAETVTEPATLAIFGLGLLGFAGAARRKQAK